MRTAITTARSPLARGQPLVDLRQLLKTYESPSGPFTALRGIDVRVQAGELVAVVGRSGSGKTTFDRSIDVLLSRVRQKLGDDAHRSTFIRTVRGVGYSFSGFGRG